MIRCNEGGLVFQDEGQNVMNGLGLDKMIVVKNEGQFLIGLRHAIDQCCEHDLRRWRLRRAQRPCCRSTGPPAIEIGWPL